MPLTKTGHEHISIGDDGTPVISGTTIKVVELITEKMAPCNCTSTSPLYLDDDLLKEAAYRRQERTPFAGVIYAHPLQVSIGKCVPDAVTNAPPPILLPTERNQPV